MSASFRVRVTPETSPIVQNLLFSKGYKWADSGKRVNFIHKSYLYAWNDWNICYSDIKNDNDCMELSMEEFTEWVVSDKLPNRTRQVEINNDYTVYVSPDKIVVGCQTITKDKVMELVRVIQEVMV